MAKFGKYKIDLKGMQVPTMRLEYELDNQFFADIDSPEVGRGYARVSLDIKKLAAGNAFELNFAIEGTAVDLKIYLTAHYAILACGICADSAYSIKITAELTAVDDESALSESVVHTRTRAQIGARIGSKHAAVDRNGHLAVSCNTAVCIRGHSSAVTAPEI